MKQYTVIIAKDGEQKSLEINAPNQAEARGFVKEKYPGWHVVRIIELR